MERLSVLVVSYNVAPLLRKCLTSLSDADEVVVVDNASSDDSVAMVRREFPGVHLVALDRNRGFSAGVNEAARAATGDLFLLLNPDASAPPSGLGRMAAAIQARPEAAAVGFRQVDPNGTFQLSFGPTPSLTLELVRMVVQRRLDAGDRRLAAFIDRRFSKPRRVPWVTGSSLLVHRSAFEAVGGFDEKFFLYFEDADFCLRLGRDVGSVYYVPDVTVVHERGASARQSQASTRRAYRDSQRLFWRRYRGPTVARLVEIYQRVRGA